MDICEYCRPDCLDDDVYIPPFAKKEINIRSDIPFMQEYDYLIEAQISNNCFLLTIADINNCASVGRLIDSKINFCPMCGRKLTGG